MHPSREHLIFANMQWLQSKVRSNTIARYCRRATERSHLRRVLGSRLLALRDYDKIQTIAAYMAALGETTLRLEKICPDRRNSRSDKLESYDRE